MPPFRCSSAAAARGDDLAGTATHVTAFLLVEHHGPWGSSAPARSRLPEEVRRHLATHPGVKVLLARRHHRAHRGSTYRVLLCFPRRRQVLGTTVERYEDLTALDLDAVARGEVPELEPGWEPEPGPVIGVCTHGRHDACCAEQGRPVAAVLSGIHPEATWEVSHVGGDRFAANLLVLPEGLYYGRVDPVAAPRTASLHAEGRLDLERLRGRASYPMPVQHAEIALRRHLEEDRFDAVRLVRRDGATSVFAVQGQEWAVTVGRTTRGEAQLTCGLERLNPLPVFETLDLGRI